MPGSCCCVKDCHSRSHDKTGEKMDNGVKFYRFPKWRKHHGKCVEELTRRRQMAWIAAVRRKDLTFNYISPSKRVCSLHFYSGKPAEETLETHPDWVPSLHLGHNEVKANNIERFLRQERRQDVKVPATMQNVGTWAPLVAKCKTKDEQEEVPHTVEVVLSDDEEQMNQEDIGLLRTIDDESTEDVMSDQRRHDEIRNLLEEHKHLENEFAELKLAEKYLKDDEKVKYYTGLPNFSTFQVLLHNVMPFLPFLPHGEAKLSHFQMVLLTFMRLKLGLPMEHISGLFGLQPATANAAFEDTISVLYACLASLVSWPDRERLGSSMPQQFMETFEGVFTVIVECFDVSIETPSDVQATLRLKYLIGISPQGVISFVSSGLTGCMSDREIAQSCGLLDYLLVGDIVLAGRGFDVEKSVGMMCAEVKTLTNGRHHLLPKTAEETKRVSHLKPQIQKVIGVVCNTYKILSSDIPVRMIESCEGESVTFLDKVVTVCCAVTNMCLKMGSVPAGGEFLSSLSTHG
uniref:THAP-type domain-containing protein n=1 Tax=Nothobranchius rachovii TaxID=451742 RepID=A0A1A8PKY3_9TELE